VQQDKLSYRVAGKTPTLIAAIRLVIPQLGTEGRSSTETPDIGPAPRNAIVVVVGEITMEPKVIPIPNFNMIGPDRATGEAMMLNIEENIEYTIVSGRIGA
jgi:hypothetical protein